MAHTHIPTALAVLGLAGAALLGGRTEAGFTVGGRNDDDEDLRRKNVIGTYSGRRTGPTGPQEIVVTLDRKREATLETDSRGSRRTHRAQWEYDREKELVTLVIVGQLRGNRMTFRADGQTLRATQWDRNAWGSDGWSLRRTNPAGDMAGVWIHSRPGPSTTQRWELDLQRGGTAILRQEAGRLRPDLVSRGTWEVLRGGDLRVSLRRGSDTETLTFRPGRDRLEPVTWDRQIWGGTPPRFLREDEAADDLIGSYWDRRFGGRRVLHLELMRGGQARLTRTSPGTRPPVVPEVHDGTWRELSRGAVDVEVSRPDKRLRFLFRREGDELIATSWDRQEFGPEAPTFTRGGAAESALLGRYLSRRQTPRGVELLTLELAQGGRATLTAEILNREDPTTYRGTWEERPGARLEVEVSRGGRTWTFVFRQEEDRLVATTWDREEFGTRPLEFDRLRSRD